MKLRDQRKPAQAAGQERRGPAAKGYTYAFTQQTFGNVARLEKQNPDP